MSRFAHLEFGDLHEEGGAARAETGPAEEAQRLAEADRAFRAGYFEKALRQYSRAVQLNPHLVPAWAGQVRLLLELNEVEEAGAWADRALERLPEAPELLALKAVASARCGDLEAALAFSDASLREPAETPALWLARGEVLLARRERRSDYCFSKALAAAPGDWLWPWLTARVYRLYRAPVLALKLARQALALEAAAAVLWIEMGRSQRALGWVAEARQALARARQLDPECPEARGLEAELDGHSPWQTWVGRWRRWWSA